MIPTDDQVERAIAAFDETWRKRPDITVKNFDEARRDSMRAALRAVAEERPEHMTDLVKNIETAQQAFEDLMGEVEAMRNAITHPHGKRAYFIDSQDQIRVDELTAVLDKASAAREAIAALQPSGEMVLVPWPEYPTQAMFNRLYELATVSNTGELVFEGDTGNWAWLLGELRKAAPLPAQPSGEMFLTAYNANGEPRAAMRINNDSCAEIAETLLEWHDVDPTRTLRIVPREAFAAPLPSSKREG